jgi:hypothetical protein
MTKDRFVLPEVAVKLVQGLSDVQNGSGIPFGIFAGLVQDSLEDLARCAKCNVFNCRIQHEPENNMSKEELEKKDGGHFGEGAYEGTYFRKGW